MSARGVCVLWPTALLVACTQVPDGDARTLREALERAAQARDPQVRPEDFAHTAGRARWLARPLSGVAARLGARSMTWRGTFSLEGAEGVAAAREEQTTLTLAATGDYALRHENAWRAADERGVRARSCWRLGDVFYVARDDAPASRLEGEGTQAEACLDTALEPVMGWLKLYDDRVAYTVDAAQTDATGARTHAVRVTLDPSRVGDGAAVPIGAFFEAGARETRALQDTFDARPPLAQTHGRPTRLEGTLTLDTATGVPLEGRIDASVDFVKRGVPLTLRVEMTWAFAPSDAAPAPPSQFVERGPRPRIFEEQRAILGPGVAAASAPAGGDAPLPAPGDAPPLAPDLARPEPDPREREAPQ